MNLSEYVNIDINMARSVNLERDISENTTLKDYQVTTKCREILSRFVSGLGGEKVSAWSLTGPYGMGKSAFANFLMAIAGLNTQEAKIALKKLRENDAELEQALNKNIKKRTGGKGFLRVPLTAAYEPINRSLVSGLARALKSEYNDTPKKRSLVHLRDQVQKLSSHEHPETQAVVEVFNATQKIFGVPILLIVDEFGKNLEYMAHHPDKGDIYIMQLLAEASNLYIWVCLHQAFDGYAIGLTAQQRQEWSKVQGRFEDISFIESPKQMITLMQRTIHHRNHPKISSAVQKWAAKLWSEMNKFDLKLFGIMDKNTIAALYPLHPLSAIVLPELCRRFAQNDRTLFSFLCSGDPRALSNFLNISDMGEKLPSVGLDYLYDYFFSVSTSAFLNRPESQRWIEIHDVISQANTLSPVSKAILKSIGVLNLLSGSFGLSANRDLLKFALKEPLEIMPKKIEEELMALAEQKTLLFREYAKEYRLWEGSDFDIASAVREKKATIATRPLQETLQTYYPQPPVTASRHSYETGTVRRFESRWMSYPDLKKTIIHANVGYDGVIVYCYGNFSNLPDLSLACADGKPLIIVYTKHENQIQEFVLEAAATRAVLIEAPELVRDGVARKEARYRVKAAEDQLREYLGQIYSPGSKEARWYASGQICKINSYRDLSSLVSKQCDEAFKLCPKIRNEMINSERQTNAAAQASRALAEAMVAHEMEEQLGLSGFGPEVAVYRSLFKVTGLHIKKNDNWQFVAPEKKSNPELMEIWNRLNNEIKGNKFATTGISIRKLMDNLKIPPFGLREGPLPLLICHYLIVHADEIALYQEGAYKPYFGEAEISLLIKRPELFAIKHYAYTGLGREVFQAYLQVLNTDFLNLRENVRNPSLLKIVSPLIQFMEGLPEYTRFTRNISIPAQRLRASVLNAREPIDLLFREIPEALGIEPISQNVFPGDVWKSHLRDKLQETLIELDTAFQKLNGKIQDTLMKAFNFKSESENSLNAFHKSIKNRVEPIFSHCADPELKPILASIISHSSDDAEWIRGIAGRIVKKPVDVWRDGDFEPFQATIYDIANRVESLILLIGSGLKAYNDEIFVFSFMRPDGKMSRRVINLNEGIKDRIEEDYKLIFNAPLKVKEALCAMLTMSLEEMKK